MKNHSPENTWLSACIGLLSQEPLKVESYCLLQTLANWREAWEWGEMKWAQKSSGGFLSPTQDHHRVMEGHQQGDGQAAWPVVKGPRWGFLTLLR